MGPLLGETYRKERGISMPSKKCRDCGVEISAGAGKCPYCGKPQITRRTWGCCGLVIIFLLLIIFCILMFQKLYPGNRPSVSSETTPIKMNKK
jgi:hypothetical protein